MCMINEKDYDLSIQNFCVIYRPDALNFVVFMELLEQLLIHLRTLKQDCILFGDFNVDTLTADNEQHQYTNMLAAYGFAAVQNNSPTRVTSTTATCLNHIMSSFPIETETIKITISDHFALEASNPLLSYNREDKTACSPEKYRSLKNLKGKKAISFVCISSKFKGSGHEWQLG